VLAGGPGPLVAVGATALLGFGFSFPWSSIAATVLKRTPSAERGSAVGILSAFYDLFVGISSFAAGWVAHQFGYAAAFFMAAVALVAAAIAGRFVFFSSLAPHATARSEPEGRKIIAHGASRVELVRGNTEPRKGA
jgi:MFS family permease